MKATDRAEITATTNELVKISTMEINGEKVECVNARDLHEKLESKQDFIHWIQNRIEKYGFIEWIDHTINLSDGKWFWKWAIKKDYILTLDTAKEIAMVENNEKWREIRQYFIEIEKQHKAEMLKQIEESKKEADFRFENPSPKKVHEMFMQWYIDAQFLPQVEAENRELKKELETLQKLHSEQIKELTEKVENQKLLQTNISSMAQGEILLSMEEAGEILGWIYRNKIYLELRARKVLKKDNSPYKFYDWEYFIQKQVKYKKWLTKKVWLYMQTFVKPKWLELLKEIFKQTLFLPA